MVSSSDGRMSSREAEETYRAFQTNREPLNIRDAINVQVNGQLVPVQAPRPPRRLAQHTAARQTGTAKLNLE